MTPKFEFEKLPGTPDLPDKLHIDFGKGKFDGGFNIVCFKDKDTKQFVYFSPGLDISSYGETEQKAMEMFKEAVHAFYESLLKKSRSQIEKELSLLGWKKDKLRNKDFSKAYIDVEGTLQNFNAEDNKIRRLTLVS